MLKAGTLFPKTRGVGANDGFRPRREGAAAAEVAEAEEELMDDDVGINYDVLCGDDEAAAEAEDAAAAAEADEGAVLAQLAAMRVTRHGRVVRPSSRLED